MDHKTAAHLNQIHGKSMAWVKERRAQLRARMAELDAMEAKQGVTPQIRADRQEVMQQYEALNEFLEHDKPKFDPLAERPHPKAGILSKAWFVMTPLIIWSVVCWLVGAFLFIFGGAVLAAAVYGDVDPAMAKMEPLIPYAHHGFYLGLLVGGIKAFRRLSVSREDLWSLQYSRRRR